jgi:hypothetical protein
MEEKRNIRTYRILMGKPEGEKPPVRPRFRWDDNIKKALREIGYVGMNWIDLAEDRDQLKALVNMEMNLRVPQNFVKNS